MVSGVKPRGVFFIGFKYLMVTFACGPFMLIAYMMEDGQPFVL